MPSIHSLICALAATGCVMSALPAPANAFWLIPGSRKSHDTRSMVEKTGAELRKTVTGHEYPEERSSIGELLRALQEVGHDVGSSTTLAKTTLMRGMYMRQNDNEYLLAMDVPGLHTKEVSVGTDRGTLRISGERKCPNLVGTDTVDPLCVERYYDASFTFPSDADEESAKAHLDAGVVYVRVPKLKGERRGVGRIVQLTSDTAEWMYEGSGAKNVVDSTANAANAVKDKIVGGAKAATDSAASAASKATDSAKHTGKKAQKEAGKAANNAANKANAATETIKSAAGKATNVAKGAAADAEEEDRIVGKGSAEGTVPVDKKDEL